MTSGTHVVVVLDATGGWADVLGPFPTRADAVSFRRRIINQTKTRRGYFGLDPSAVVVSPLLSADAYEQARADIADAAANERAARPTRTAARSAA